MAQIDELKKEATELGIEVKGTETAKDLREAISKVSGKDNAKEVSFSAEQLAIVNKMIENAVGNSKNTSNPNSPISVYNTRDPKSIDTVNVRRFEGKFVLGFKDQNTDPFRKTPQWLRYGVDPIRKLANEPYVTLLLSDDGKTIVEKEVLLIDYMNSRDVFVAPVINVEVKEVINDHGILGNSGAYAVAVDAKGRTEARTTILAQSKSVYRTFTVHLPGFEKETTFISDFLA